MIILKEVKNYTITCFSEELLTEAKTVTFGNRTYPTNGWAVVMAGGPGVGKSHALNTKIAISAKVLDTDKLKKMYIKSQSRSDTIISKFDTRSYDLKVSQDVSDLHNKIKQKDYLNKYRYNFLTNNTRLDNVIFDITGSKSSRLMDLGIMLKDLNYNTSLVWVISTRQIAIKRNSSRGRQIALSDFHEIHNEINNNVLNFLQTDAANYYDEAWVIFTSNESGNDMSHEEEKEFIKSNVYKLASDGNSFDIAEDVIEKIIKTLGPNEPNPSNPEIYK